jgi:hypothetical protein
VYFHAPTSRANFPVGTANLGATKALLILDCDAIFEKIALEVPTVT